MKKVNLAHKKSSFLLIMTFLSLSLITLFTFPGQSSASNDSDSSFSKIKNFINTNLFPKDPNESVQHNSEHTTAKDFRSRETAKWETYTLEDQTLTSIAEDIMIINGQAYQFSGKTKFFISEHNSETPVRISPRNISLPSKCDILFKQFTSSDEAHPNKSAKNVLETLYIKH